MFLAGGGVGLLLFYVASIGSASASWISLLFWLMAVRLLGLLLRCLRRFRVGVVVCSILLVCCLLAALLLVMLFLSLLRVGHGAGHHAGPRARPFAPWRLKKKGSATPLHHHESRVLASLDARQRQLSGGSVFVLYPSQKKPLRLPPARRNVQSPVVLAYYSENGLHNTSSCHQEGESTFADVGVMGDTEVDFHSRAPTVRCAPHLLYKRSCPEVASSCYTVFNALPQ